MILALFLLSIVELGVARRDWLWRRFPRSSVGVIFAIESRVIDKADAPFLVCLGNSRLQDAIVPRVLEKEMSLPEGSVLNLAIRTGMPYDSLTMYMRNREKLSRAKLLLLDFECHYFNKRIELTSRIGCFASLRDRLEMFYGSERLLPSLIGWAWRTIETKDVIRNLLWPENENVSSDLLLAEDGRVVWRNPNEEWEIDIKSNTSDNVDRFFGGSWYPNEEHARQFRKLVRLARQDGLRVVLLHVPYQDSFVECVEERYSEVFRLCKEDLERLSKECDLFLNFDRGSEIGVDEEEFFDYVHLRAEGAERLTKVVANALNHGFGSMAKREW